MNNTKIKTLMDQMLALPNGPDIQQKALDISKEIISLKPNEPEYYVNHALCCFDFALYDEAIEVLEIAKSMLPGCPIIRRILSTNLFHVGRFREGFAEFEWRFKELLPESPKSFYSPAFESPSRLLKWYKKPYWDGVSDISCKTLMAFNEGGYGDLIQNIRYLFQLRPKCKKLILEVKKDLITLVKEMNIIDGFIEYSNNAERLFFPMKNKCYAEVDVIVSLHSLMPYFDPDLSNTPKMFPYIHPCPSANAAIDIVKNCPAKIKIGIVWAGNKGHDNDFRRSCFKRDMLPLTNIPNVQLFDLQKGDMDRNWQFVGKVNLLKNSDEINSIDLGPMIIDFNDTANIIKELTGIVTVDTSAGHLAGALNKPVWLALPHNLTTEWRWQKQWYASQTIMRQKDPGNWQELFTRIANDISSKLS